MTRVDAFIIRTSNVLAARRTGLPSLGMTARR